MEPNDKLKKLESLLKLVDESLTRAEFVKAFEEVIKLTKKIEEGLISKIDTKLSSADTELSKQVSILSSLKEDFKQAVQETRDSNETTFANVKKRTIEAIDNLFVKMRLNDKFNEMMLGHTRMMSAMDKKMNEVKDGLDGVSADEIKIVQEILSKIPPQKEETSIETRDKLETLKDNERLDKSAIKGLEDEIKNLRKEIAAKSGGGVRRVFQPYVDDFSALTNGSTKIFYLSREPLRTDTVQIFGTDFPSILRPVTDFTISGKTLTLTSAVPSPSQGATLLAHYFA